MTRFVRRLVWLRRNEILLPEDAASLVGEQNKAHGFPNVATWAGSGAKGWDGCPCTTSAEAAVKYAGFPTPGALSDTRPHWQETEF